jgi:hypothetical protein
MKFPAFFTSIRGKLITIFVLIKVLPLLLLAWFAWHAAQQLGEDVSLKAGGMADAMLSSIKTVGQTVTERFTNTTPGNWPTMANHGCRRKKSARRPKSPARSWPITPRTFMHARLNILVRKSNARYLSRCLTST